MILVVDTETTGLVPEVDCIIEVASVALHNLSFSQSFARPTAPINLKAMAAHHITPPMLSDAPDLIDALAHCRIDKAAFLVAHNAAFDRGFIKREDVPWICTYRCAMHLWPNAPGHGNQVLRYWLALDDVLHEGEGAAIMRLPPHRALPDAWVTAHLLMRLLLLRPLVELQRLTDAPLLLENVGFGKFFGKKWREVDRSYLQWVSRNDFDKDTLYTARHYLGAQR